MKHAIFSIDPGTTTGLAEMVFSTESRHPVERMTVVQIPSNPRSTDDSKYQSYERVAAWLYARWMDFRTYAIDVHHIRYAHHELVCEDFTLRTSARDQDVLSPVYISCILQGLRMDIAGPLPRTIWSSPATQAVIQREAMKQAHIDTPGAPHGRSAVRHAVARARGLGYFGVLSERVGKPEPYRLEYPGA